MSTTPLPMFSYIWTLNITVDRGAIVVMPDQPVEVALEVEVETVETAVGEAVEVKADAVILVANKKDRMVAAMVPTDETEAVATGEEMVMMDAPDMTGLPEAPVAEAPCAVGSAVVGIAVDHRL